MDVKLHSEGRYRFGPFVVDPAARELLRDGTPIALTGRLFETLLVFIRNPGRILTKDELFEAIWPGRYVEESSLKQAISSLRKALGEDVETQYIVTAAGRGYSFTAPVVQETGRAANTPVISYPTATAADHAPSLDFGTQADTNPRGAARLKWRRIAYIAGFALAFVLMVGLALIFRERWAAMLGQPKSASGPRLQSVAVLPFANLSGDPGQQYLADGFSEELIDTLNNVSALRVADRTSSFYFGTHPAPMAEIARRLHVGAVLEGSMRRDGQHLRITVALTNALGGYRYWTHSYDRDFADILNLQREIATNVTQSLLATLHAGAAVRMPTGGTNNSAAFDDFLRGLRLMRGRDEKSYKSALAAFDAAIRLDPHYAVAEELRAYVLTFLGEPGSLAQALDAANHAISLVPGWGEGHAAKGFVLLQMLDFAGAERELLRARSLAPGDVNIDRPFSYLECWLGHRMAAEAAAARVVARIPSDSWGYWDQADVYYYDRRYQDALAAAGHAKALVATGAPGGEQANSGFAWLALGRPDVAASICAATKTPEETECLAIVEHRLGKVADAEAQLAALHKSLDDRGAYNYAQIYAQWGEPELALHWLNAAYGMRDTGLIALKVDPLLDPIRKAPGFADIERRLNFPG
jgi:TolB-like protein/DNA-binding winged helix-turn-helix (wHTH) protein